MDSNDILSELKLAEFAKKGIIVGSGKHLISYFIRVSQGRLQHHDNPRQPDAEGRYRILNHPQALLASPGAGLSHLCKLNE
jgi:hypothetical protein